MMELPADEQESPEHGQRGSPEPRDLQAKEQEQEKDKVRACHHGGPGQKGGGPAARRQPMPALDITLKSRTSVPCCLTRRSPVSTADPACSGLLAKTHAGICVPRSGLPLGLPTTCF